MGRKVYDQDHEHVSNDDITRHYIYERIGYTGNDFSTPRPYNRYFIDINNRGSRYFRDELPDQTRYEFFASNSFTRNERNIYHNRLVSKLRRACGPQSAFGSSVLAEGRETIQMLAQNIEWVTGIVKAASRKDFKRLAKYWQRPRRVQEACADAGGIWLQFSWGWRPLVSTVRDSLAALSQDPSPRIVTVTHQTSGRKIWNLRNADVRAQWEFNSRMHDKLSYYVSITNGNTWLLNSLELLSPQNWVWEAIPMSWLVDYFIQVGDYLGSLNSFAGVKLDFRYHSHVLHSNVKSKAWNNVHNPGATGEITFFDFSRNVSPNAPDLSWALTYNFTNPLSTSITRTANASAFVAAQMRWKLPSRGRGWYENFSYDPAAARSQSK